MPCTLRSPLAAALALGPAFFRVNGSAQDPTDTQTAMLFEGLKRAGVKLATALEAKSHLTVMGPLSYTCEDHLPSGPWYVYEYPDRKPKLLKRVDPAYEQ